MLFKILPKFTSKIVGSLMLKLIVKILTLQSIRNTQFWIYSFEIIQGYCELFFLWLFKRHITAFYLIRNGAAIKFVVYSRFKQYEVKIFLVKTHYHAPCLSKLPTLFSRGGEFFRSLCQEGNWIDFKMPFMQSFFLELMQLNCVNAACLLS